LLIVSGKTGFNLLHVLFTSPLSRWGAFLRARERRAALTEKPRSARDFAFQSGYWRRDAFWLFFWGG